MLAAATTPQAASPQAGRTILAGSYSPEKLAGILTPRQQWKPYPTLSDRAAWQALPEPIRKALLAAGESNLGKEWPALPATLFLEYKRIGNRSHFEQYWNLRRTMLRSLVMAECVEGKGRFLDSIANGIWTTCEETFWGYPAHLGAQKAVRDCRMRPNRSSICLPLRPRRCFPGRTICWVPRWTKFLRCSPRASNSK